MKRLLIDGLAVAFVLWATGVRAVQVPAPLVDTEWLATNLSDIVLLDLRKDTLSFTQPPPPAVLTGKQKKMPLKVRGHIPGARLVDFKDIRTKREIDGAQVDKMVPVRGDFEEVMQSAGVNRDDPLVIATKGEGTLDLTMGTRLYWQLKYFGHDNVAILDGGTARWIKEKRPVTTELSEAAPGDWVAATERRELLATSEDVAGAAAEKVVLLDSRPVSQYLGTAKRDYVSEYGHIPGAKNYPSDLMTAQDPGGGFLPAAKYRELARALGLDLDAETITYCNSGHFASGAWFLMSEILGNPNVRLYDGSMLQWTLEKRPVASMKIE